MGDVWDNSMACHPRATWHIAGCCRLVNSMSWSETYVSHCRVLRPGEFNDMWPQSHVLHCTLQGAATWWIHTHDSRATCHIVGCSHLAKSMSWSCHIAGCNNSIRHTEILSAKLKIVFRHILFFMQFRLWRAAAFISSLIHLLSQVTSSRQLAQNNERLVSRSLSWWTACPVVGRQTSEVSVHWHEPWCDDWAMSVLWRCCDSWRSAQPPCPDSVLNG